MLRVIIISFVFLPIAALAIMGWRGKESANPPLQIWDDMVEQAKYKPQSQSSLFADGRAERPNPFGAVAWGRNPQTADPQYQITDEDQFRLDKLPAKIDRALLNRGQEVFTIYCAACHGLTGAGNGATTQYGMNNPPTYHSDRLRQVTDGYIYQVITQGKNTMGLYGDRIHRADRWAVVAYVRALQRANNARIDDVPADARKELAK